MKNSEERLYWFYIIDGRQGKSEEGEQMIKSFIGRGHKFDNLFIFTSAASIEEINTFIKEHKMKDFMYLLVDMTDNITTETFKTIVNEDYYRPAEKFMKLLKDYQPKSGSSSEFKDANYYQKQADEILDLISKKGVKSLKPEQKQFMEDFSKGKFDSKNRG
jgi:hypothetical protein